MALSVILCFSTDVFGNKALHGYNKNYMDSNAGLTGTFWRIILLKEWLYPYLFAYRALAQLKTGEAIDCSEFV
jgi:hypothetical protein